MPRAFVPALLQVGQEPAQMLKLYDRTEETVSKKGFRMLGQLLVNGEVHYVTGFLSPSTGEAPKKAKKSKTVVI